MFEDSLVESCGRIRTRSHRYVAGSWVLQAALVATLALIPYLYPEALPVRFLSVPLLAPRPAPALAMVAQPASAATVAHPEMLLTLTAPPRIPTLIPHVADPAPPSLNIGAEPSGVRGNGPVGVILPGFAPPPAPRVQIRQTHAPTRVSAGVAAGQLIAPIRPVYPVIARETHTHGTVVIEATISAAGRIENTRVVSGPALLVHAAEEAVREARYKPFLLNGVPVEVETTIRIVFSLQ